MAARRRDYHKSRHAYPDGQPWRRQDGRRDFRWRRAHVRGSRRRLCRLLGSNSNGALGDGTTTNRDTPTQTASLGAGRTAVAISAGTIHTCATLDDRSIACWGSNSHGQLGDGTTTNRDTPTNTLGIGKGWTPAVLSGGHSHTCAILDDGSIACWGSNHYGQLGDGTTTNLNIPGQRPASEPAEQPWQYQQVRATLARSSTTAQLPAGGNQYGQLGDGTTQIVTRLP